MNEKRGSYQSLEYLSIQYFGRDMRLIDEILHSIRQEYVENTEGLIRVHTVRWGSNWSNSNLLPERSLDSVICRDGLIQSLHDDVQEFYGTEDWYARLGIPYHRGYLLYGPPGCGKTSVIFAIASTFRRPVYCLAIGPNLTDENLITLLSDVPPKAILVLEDIDSVFTADRQKVADTRLTFSTLLNAIDGFSAKHGTVLFMTTNHIERLDSALIRPGRVDFRASFDLCDRKQAKEMFERFYGTSEMGSTFAGLIDDDVLSPAQVQQFLMLHKDDPREAIRDCPRYVKDQAA